MVRRSILLLLLTICLLANTARGGVLVHFDQDVNVINPGDQFDVQILLDMDDSTPGQQVPAAGLYSMGINVSFESSKAQVNDISSIILPPALNGDGVGGAAPKSVGPGFAGCFGAVDFFATEGYKDPLLATITLKDMAVGPYPYELNLDFFYTNTLTNFADYDGNSLDDVISFGSTTVFPEPTTLSFLVLGGLAMMRKRQRK